MFCRLDHVIFITENDVPGKDLSLYHVDRMIRETKELFGDGSHIIYVNGAYHNDKDPVGKLMHDFRYIDAEPKASILCQREQSAVMWLSFQSEGLMPAFFVMQIYFSCAVEGWSVN